MNEVIIIILIFGVFGGVVNFLLIEDIKSINNKTVIRFELFKSIFVGLAAAFLVPLFLNMISSDLIDQIKTKQSNLLIIAGFCLIASISSKAFIDTISKKILTDFNNRINEIAEEVKPIIEKETELDNPNINSNVITDRIESRKNDSKRIMLLRVLSNGKYTYRSLRGIINELNIEPIVVNKVLSHLISNGFVGQNEGKQGLRFFITDEGRTLLYEHDSKSYSYIIEETIEKQYLGAND